MKKTTIVALLLCFLAIILFFFDGLNVWVGLGLLVLALAVYINRSQNKTINDLKILWIYAQNTPAGIHDLPDFDEIDPLFRGWQWEKNFAFCIYVWKNRRFGIILDSVISPEHKVIHFKQAVSNKISLSQIRDIAIKAAYGRNDRFSPEWLQKKVESLGGRIVWGKAPVAKPQQENSDVGNYADYNTTEG